MTQKPKEHKIPTASELIAEKQKSIVTADTDPSSIRGPVEFEGTEKFEESITHMHEFNQGVVTSKDIDDLTDLIGQTNHALTIKYKYELPRTQENLYKEVSFETSELEFYKSTINEGNLIRAKRTLKIRNWDKHNAESINSAVLPIHPKFHHTTKNKFEEFADSYKYLENPTEGHRKVFDAFEDAYRNSLTVKHKFLEQTFLKEISNREFNAHIVPVQIGSFVYYRNINNLADLLTLYRYPVNKIDQENRGKVPTKDLDLYEQVVFSIRDLTPYYDQFALKLEAIKNFVEKIADLASVPSYDPLN